MRIVIKVGTQAILTAAGDIDKPLLATLVWQIVQLQRRGIRVVLVSSGAVGAGKGAFHRLIRKNSKANDVGDRQLAASLGQHQLIHCYAEIFHSYQIEVSQILLTKQDFSTRQHYINITRLLDNVLNIENIIAIINENDSVAIEELMFTDNDELAGLLAGQMNADKLIILTSVAGVYDRSPSDRHAKLIPLIDPKDNNWPVVTASKNRYGRGGMSSKLEIARKMSSLGAVVHIAHAREPDIILRLLKGESLGTTILAKTKKSALKRWIAFCDGKHQGAIYINQGLLLLLKQSTKALSILPIGIVAKRGYFKKGDLVKILSEAGEKVGLGIAKYDADQLMLHIGKHDRAVFIHYNQLHIDDNPC